MIILENIQKTYRSKNKKQTIALKNVSLSLPDNGLVFILGKSGSGKTTLLNILGSLDSFDSGEMIVNGKSLKQLKQKEVDDYRKNYVGFVFQDFNLLDEFNVKDNIELALRLQGEKDNQDDISRLLKEMDLGNIESKFPQELSGGQKQRVAIARALIKKPKMILADEPCGSLDEETGENIIQILKRESKDKLVVVVSHNNSLAEKYADRIIKMREGIILEEKVNQRINQEPHLNPNSEKEETNNSLKKSKLPWNFSLKMGFHYLSTRKIRLAFTILFSFLSLSLFSVSEVIANYSPANSIYHSLTSRKNRHFSVSYEAKHDNDDYFTTQRISEETKEHFERTYGVLSDGTCTFSSSLGSSFESYPISLPEINESPNLLNVSENRMTQLGFSLLCGKLPEKTDEIALTDYHFYIFQNIGFKDFTNHACPNVISGSLLQSPSDLLGKTICFSGNYCTISGFLNTNTISNYHEYLDKLFSFSKEEVKNYIKDNSLEYDFFKNEISYNYPSNIYCSSSFESKLKGGYGFHPIKSNLSPMNNGNEPHSYGFDRFATDAVQESTVEFLGDYQNIADSSQIIVSSSLKSTILEVDDTKTLEENDQTASFIEFVLKDGYWEKVETNCTFSSPSDFFNRGKKTHIFHYLLNHLPNNSVFEKYCLDYYHSGALRDPSSLLTNEMKAFAYFSFLTNEYDYRQFISNEMKDFIFKKAFDEGIMNPFGTETKEYLDDLFENYVYGKYKKDKNYVIHCEYQNIKTYTDKKTFDFTVIGFFDDPFGENAKKALVSKEIFDQLTDPINFGYSNLLCDLDGKEIKMYDLLKDSFNQKTNERFYLKNPVSGKVVTFHRQLSFLSSTFSYVGLILGILSVLLFCYFILGTIYSSTKEIGILRSLGTRKMEIFRIFLTESLFVAFLDFILATILCVVSVHFLNLFAIEKIGLAVSVYFFDWLSAFILLGLSFISALISSSVPFLSFLGKKPISIIKKE